MSVEPPIVPPPSPDVSVGELVSRTAGRTPDKLALKLRETGETRTYAELDRRGTRLANGLLGIGLRPGDRLATWVEDRAEYVELYVAAAKAGLRVAPINARFVAAEARHILEDSEATALVWTPGLAAQVEALGVGGTPAITIGIGDAPAAHALEDLIAAGAEEAPPPPDPGETFILGYTSGTTGKPKAAMLSHRAVVAAGRGNYVSYRLSADAVFGLTGSMSFVAVVPAHVICALGLGATLVMMGRYDVATLIETIEREGITFTYCPSPLLAEFAAAVKAAPQRVRTLHSVMHSASKADPKVLKAVYEAVGDRLIEGWGMTENSGSLATATVPADYLDADRDDTVFSTVGRAAVGCAVRVAGEDGEELPHDGETIGNLAFRSPGQASGYWNRPEATAEAMVDGWIFTGDLGSIDADGYVRVTERRTDLIVSGGMNVYPSEVEQCIKGLDGVLDVGVVGVPHERWGQAVVAAAVVAAGGPDEAAIIAHCREHLASFKKPSEVVFMDELPYTATQKLARAVLREELARDRPAT